MNIDLKQSFSDLAAQFEGLQGRHPGLWPLAPRLLCAAGVMAAVLGLGYYFYWSGQFDEQDMLAAQELKLRDDYKTKMAQAINLDALEAQQQQVNRYVERLEKQLPSKAEMAALLSDINQAGLGRGLQFELFKPGQVVVKDYYAELPIDIKVTGTYHDIGEFAADMARMPRIVTLNNLALTAGKDGVLSLDAIAKTFRYLDQDELDAQSKARKAKKATGKDAKNGQGAKP
ncbi:MAG: type 4a pilus biogenesis protein PilO [Massilia sp.]|nr:type 4a pilus biogenesis protein PilO [Massilia sp.]